MKFKEILSQLNIPTAPEGHHHARPDWINLDCPYCGRDSQKWHLGYSIEGGFLNCWQCGGHNLINTLMEITHLPYYQIKKLVSDLEPSFIKREKPTGKLIMPSGIKHLSSIHKKYLHSRGFNWRKIQCIWQIKGIGIAPNLQWRIFIPIIYHSQIVSWTTRSISKKENITRYISASEEEESMPHHELLYGEDFARGAVIVTEGVFDVWRIGVGAVCTFSTGYSQEQLERIVKYPTRAICFDNEKEAQKRARKLVNDLSVFPGDTYNIILDNKDPAEESRKNIKQLRKEILE